MGVPRRKARPYRMRSRRRSRKPDLAACKPCPRCGASHLPHRVCPSCGYYRDRQVLTVEAE